MSTSLVSSSTDRILLEGPHSRRKELWLVLRSLKDFIAGFRTLHFVGPCVTVFGSARYGDSHPYYALGRNVGAGLARLHRDDRRRPRADGSSQQGRARGGRAW